MRQWLILVFLVTSSPVYAEWVKLTSSSNSTVYIDKSSITRRGDIVEIDQLFDFSRPTKSDDDKYTYKSSMGREAYNCKTNEDKTISFTWYSDNMAKGKVLYVDKGHEDYPWRGISKDTLSDAIRKEICKKPTSIY